MSAIARGFGATAWAVALVGALLSGGVESATAGDKLTEKNMTRDDYIGLTATETSIEEETHTEPPRPVHNLTDDQLKDMATLGAAKVISARDWKNETLQERDAHLRRIKKTLPAGASMILTVPKGEVWVIPAREDPDPTSELNKARERLRVSIRQWDEAEILALPWSVARDKPISQSDKRGTGSDRRSRTPVEVP